MNILIILILISLFVASGFVFAFIWAVKNGQFDDSYTPSIRILWENGKAKDSKPKESIQTKS